MKLNNKNISSCLFYILLIVEISIIVLVGYFPHNNVSFKNEPYYFLNEHWTYIDERGKTYFIDLPAKLGAVADKTVVISRFLPTNIKHLTTLSILTSHQGIEAYIDDELIYTKINNTPKKFFDVPSGSIWHMIQLPQGCEGKKITLKLVAEYEDYSGKIDEVHVGTKAALLIHSIETSGISFFLSLITLFMGIVIVMIYLFLKRSIAINRSFLFLGWFSILASLWMIMESNLTQIFIKNEYVISSLTYLSLMIFPIPFLLYITLIENIHYKKIFYLLNYCFLGSTYSFIFLQIFNIMDFHESMFIVRAEILLLFSSVIIILCLELFYYKNREIKTFTFSAGLLFGFFILELMNYNSITQKNTGIFFQFGFLIFVVILLWSNLKKAVEVIKLSESALHYKRLATCDQLTNCRSRVSYVKDMECISLDRNITFFVADINNMKQVNDTYGHHAGDEIIILCSQCLLKVFGKSVYRIGGDEFVCIEYDLNKVSTEAMLNEFLVECKKVNEDSPYYFDVSIGYAVFDKDKDKTIYDTVNRADRDMYDRKNMMKK